MLIFYSFYAAFTYFGKINTHLNFYAV